MYAENIRHTCFHIYHFAFWAAIFYLAALHFVLLLTNFVSSVSVAQLNRDDDFMKIDGEWYKG